MTERKKKGTFLSSVMTKEAVISGAALAVAVGGTYVSTSQISALKETVEKNEGMLITTIRNVDQLVDSAPDPEKIQELKKSIDLNARTLEQIQKTLSKIEEKVHEQDYVIHALKENASEWLGFEHHPSYSSQYQPQSYPPQYQPQSYSPPQQQQRGTRSLADML